MPKLVSPINGEKLILYVSVSKYSLSGVLVAEREKKQFPVYYVSHAFRGSEGNYSEVEKVLFAVVMASRKLKPYCQSHQIIVRTSQPLKKILEGKNKSSWKKKKSSGVKDSTIRKSRKKQMQNVMPSNKPPLPKKQNKWPKPMRKNIA